MSASASASSETREAKLANRDGKLAERRVKLAEREAKLANPVGKLGERKVKLANRIGSLPIHGKKASFRDRELCRPGAKVSGPEAWAWSPAPERLAAGQGAVGRDEKRPDSRWFKQGQRPGKLEEPSGKLEEPSGKHPRAWREASPAEAQARRPFGKLGRPFPWRSLAALATEQSSRDGQPRPTFPPRPVAGLKPPGRHAQLR